MEELSLEEVNDMIILVEKNCEYLKEMLRQGNEFSTKVANIMTELKTDYGRLKLAELTQHNYAVMIENEVALAELNKNLEDLKVLKKILNLGGIEQ